MILVPIELVRQIEIPLGQFVFYQDRGDIAGEERGFGLGREADHRNFIGHTRMIFPKIGQSALAAQEDVTARHDLSAKAKFAAPTSSTREQLRQLSMLKIRKPGDGGK